MRQVPLPEKWRCHRALAYFTLETALLLLLELVCSFESRTFWFFLPGLPITLYLAALPWAVMLLIRYVPIRGWFKAAGCCGLLALYHAATPAVVERVLVLSGEEMGRPLAAFPWFTFQPGDWSTPWAIGNNVNALISLGCWSGGGVPCGGHPAAAGGILNKSQSVSPVVLKHLLVYCRTERSDCNGFCPHHKTPRPGGSGRSAAAHRPAPLPPLSRRNRKAPRSTSQGSARRLTPRRTSSPSPGSTRCSPPCPSSSPENRRLPLAGRAAVYYNGGNFSPLEGDGMETYDIIIVGRRPRRGHPGQAAAGGDAGPAAVGQPPGQALRRPAGPGRPEGPGPGST